jgi:hypothetical protein
MPGCAKLGIAVLELMPVICGAQTNPKRDAAPAPASPMIVQNPDGTLTAQKEPPNPSKGLVIPKQIVIPFSGTRSKRSSSSPRTEGLKAYQR